MPILWQFSKLITILPQYRPNIALKLKLIKTKGVNKYSVCILQTRRSTSEFHSTLTAKTRSSRTRS